MSTPHLHYEKIIFIFSIIYILSTLIDSSKITNNRLPI